MSGLSSTPSDSQSLKVVDCSSVAHIVKLRKYGSMKLLRSGVFP